MKFHKTENYQDVVGKLFPNEVKTQDNLPRTITFAVCDYCNLACKYCLSGDTLISMADGTKKPIRDVSVGDVVLGFEERTSRHKQSRINPTIVVQKFQHEDEMIEVEFEDGEILHITPNHKVLVRRNSNNDGKCNFIEIGKLSVGREVYKLPYNEAMMEIKYPMVKRKITRISPYICDTVYNIATESHTYIANNVAVHNCYEHHKQNHSMSFETAKKFIDMILDDDENTAQYIDSNNTAGAIIEFIGGEPFLEIDLIDKISDYFVQQCILRNHPWATRHMFSICSNGVLYFDPKVQSYIRKHRNNLSLSISIDGNKELHDSCRVFPDGSGSYDIAMKAVKHYMSEYGRDMGSKMTLCPENIQYTFEAVKSLIGDGYYDINLNCVYEEGWNVEHAKILYEKLKELSDYVIDNNYYDRHISIFEQKFFHPKSKDDTQTWCGAGGGKMIAVDYSGNIYPCVRFMPMSLGDKVPAAIIGNINDGIMVRKEHKDCARCIQNITRINQSTKECIECSIAEGCADCQGYNYEISGNFHTRATYICIMHKARSLANAYYWNKLFRKLGENKRFKIWLDDEEALKIIDKKEFDYLKNLSSCEY